MTPECLAYPVAAKPNRYREGRDVVVCRFLCARVSEVTLVVDNGIALPRNARFFEGAAPTALTAPFESVQSRKPGRNHADGGAREK